MFLRGDRESILKWNLTLLYYIKTTFVINQQYSEIELALSGLQSIFHLTQSSFCRYDYVSSLSTACRILLSSIMACNERERDTRERQTQFEEFVGCLSAVSGTYEL